MNAAVSPVDAPSPGLAGPASPTAARAEGRLALAARIAVTGVFGLIFWLNMGWVLGSAWLSAAALGVAWGYLIQRRLAVRPTQALEIMRLCEIAAASGVWTAMAVIYWMSGEAALRLLAYAVLGELLVAAQGQALSPTRAAVFAAPPALALIALPLFFAGYSDLVEVSLVVCGLGAVLYLVAQVRRTTLYKHALFAAQAELAAQRAVAVTASEAKSTYLAMISHELRTPLNGVLGMARALSMTPLSAQQDQQVEVMVRSGEGLLTILNDLLDISKIEAGRLELECIPLDLHDFAHRVHDLWAEAAAAKGLTLRLGIAPATPRWVSGDPTRLRQIVVNLVSNALKFTDAGEVAIRLDVDPVSDHIRIAVADTGAGLDEAQLAKLFQPFVQAEASTTRRYGGTGLGLSICRQLADLMGGTIHVASQPGRGSVFTLAAPLPACDAPTTETAFDRAALASLAGCSLLVADDNLVNQAVARSILEAMGAEVTVVNDGLELLDALAGGGAVDAILLDVHMPRMDGPTALAAIRRGEAGRRDIPVIALTADAQPDIARQLLAAGFDDVATKPVDPTALLVALLGALTARPAEEQSALAAS